MVVWEPNPEYPVIFITLLGVWGVGDGIWMSQVNSMYFSFENPTAFKFFFIFFLTFQLYCLKSELFIIMKVL